MLRGQLHLLALMALATPCAAQADIQCPPSLNGHQYARASVFDGPPEEQADLVPDGSAAGADIWQLGYIFDAGRVPYLVCRYAGTPQTATFKLQKPITSCTGPKPPRTASCH